jgi:hypothetical protein
MSLQQLTYKTIDLHGFLQFTSFLCSSKRFLLSIIKHFYIWINLKLFVLPN